MKKLKVILFAIVCITNVNAQIKIEVPSHVRKLKDTLVSNKLNKSLDTLFTKLSTNKPLHNYIDTEHQKLTLSTLNVINDYDTQFKKDSSRQISHQLINIFPRNKDKFELQLSGVLTSKNKPPAGLYNIKLVAKYTNNTVKFSIPLNNNTKGWKTKKIGLTTYIFRDSLDKKRAKKFDSKNRIIAHKFNLKPEPLTFYMCDNYQDILNLRGILYSVNENGSYRDGYGLVGNTIFSVMHNEDFSHDIMHYYSSKIHKRINRNWITEEGVSYLWGNAYYTDVHGEMIEFNELKTFFKSYLLKHPKTNIYNLFEKDIRIFQRFASEVSTRSVIAAIIVEEVEKNIGIDGVLELINAGRKERLKNFLRVTKKLIDLEADNFNHKLKEIIEK